MSSHSFITTFFKKGFLLAVACVAIFGVIGGYVHAQSTLPTDLITIDWTGANTQGFQVPQKLQTGHRFITPDTNFLHTQQQANGTVFTAEVFENYIAVSPAIYYADAALAQNYVLEFHLEDMQGELWHRIHEVPIAAAFDVNGDNVIQFRSSIQPLDAIVIDERGVRADNSLNPAAILPQNTPLVVRVYIRGNNVPRTLFNSYTLGSYAFRQSPGEALSSSWSFISQQAFASAVPGPLPFSTGQGTLSTTSSGFTQITETESSSFPETESGSYFRVSYRPFIRWLIDVELDEYDDYIFDILLQGDLGDFPGNQSEIDIAVVLSETPNFAQHNSKILIREVLSSPSFYYYRTYDPTQHSDNFVVPGQKYYLGLYVNGQLASFQQTPAFAEPANAIDVKFESQQFAGFISRTPDFQNVISYAVDMRTPRTGVGRIDFSIGSSWTSQIITDTERVYGTGNRSFAFNFFSNYESIDGTQRIPITMNREYFALVYEDGVPIAGTSLGMILDPESISSGDIDSSAFSGNVTGPTSGSIDSGAFEGNVTGPTSGSIDSGAFEGNVTGPISGSISGSGQGNIGEPRAGNQAFAGFSTNTQYAVSEVGLVPCGHSGLEDCEFKHIIILIQNLINFAFALIFPIAAIAFMYAGFLYITGGASPDKRKLASSIFGKVVLGIIFVMAAWLIVSLILSTLGVDQAYRFLDF